MGYSCSAKASEVEKAMIEILKNGDDIAQSNMWRAKGILHFADLGREQPDGAITCPVMKMLTPEGENPGRCKRVGNIRIEPSGRITRWPTSTKAQRQEAQRIGLKRFEDRFGTDDNPKPMFTLL